MPIALLPLPGRHGRPLVITLLGSLLTTAACFVAVTSPKVSTIPPDQPISLRNPIKVHLRDGSIVLFRERSTVGRDGVVGMGVRYDFTLRDSTRVAAVAKADIVGIESFTDHRNVPGSIVISLLGTGLTVAIFGSCPTLYSDSAGYPVLEAEGFSYSIAPLFEARDVDRLRVLPDSLGQVRLEVRNEAAETHYLNQIELIEVTHGPDEIVVPDADNQPVAVGHLAAPREVRDAGGRDLRAVLAAADGRVFSSERSRLASAGPSLRYDTVSVTLPPSEADSAALVLRLRNSLLTTVMLYDVMLRRQGARSLDWMASTLGDIGSAVELGRWYRREMGLRIEVGDADEWHDAGWIRDVGPIAFEDVGVVVPVDRGHETRVRLIFPIDSWRIDRLAVGGTIRRPMARRVPLSTVRDRDGAPVGDAVTILQNPDASYLATHPGDRFTAEFAVGPGRSDRRTLLLVSQGYYTEWLRPSWLRPSSDVAGFVPDSARLVEALALWRAGHDSLERQFDATKIPVR